MEDLIIYHKEYGLYLSNYIIVICRTHSIRIIPTGKILFYQLSFCISPFLPHFRVLQCAELIKLKLQWFSNDFCLHTTYNNAFENSDDFTSKAYSIFSSQFNTLVIQSQIIGKLKQLLLGLPLPLFYTTWQVQRG